MGLTWLSPKNIVYYCPGCFKTFASVGLVKNLLSCLGTHSCFDRALVFDCSIQRRHFVPFLLNNWLSWTSLQRQLKKLEDVYSSRIKDVIWAPLQTLRKSSNITGQNKSPGFIHIVLINAVSICAWFLKCQFGSLLKTRKKFDFKSNLIFFSSSNLIFTACVACKNQFRNQIDFLIF